MAVFTNHLVAFLDIRQLALVDWCELVPAHLCAKALVSLVIYGSNLCLQSLCSPYTSPARKCPRKRISRQDSSVCKETQLQVS